MTTSTVRAIGTRAAAMAALLALLLSLLPAVASGQDAPAVPGRLASSSPDVGDGVKVFVRFINSDRLYAVHVNRRDGGMRIQRKEGNTYYSLEPPGERPTYVPRYGEPQRVEVSAVDGDDGSVRFALRIDGRTIHTAVDTGQTPAGAPIRAAGSVGIRADNTEFLLDDLDVYAATSDGSPGAALIRDPFDRPDGLITNMRIQSTQDPTWRVYSGSLFAVGGQAWSGMPDDVRPDPESRWSTYSSTFRMVSHREDLTDVVVSFGLINRGYVTPSVVPEIAPPAPEPYPTGTGAVAVTRLDGSNNERVAINASRRAFASGADEVVLASTTMQAASVAAPALAGAVQGPILLTPSRSLHAETAAELARLGARTVHLVGEFSDAVRDQLSAAGLRVRVPDGSSAEARTAAVARQVGGSHLYLATTESWQDGLVVSGAAAATVSPVVLTPADRLGTTAGQVIEDNGVTRVTIIGNELDPEVVAALRADGIEVDRAGHRRYAIARSAAQAQDDAGGSPAALWVAAGQRPLHSLAAGPAAAHSGGILLIVDGDELGDTSLEDLGYQGYESRHWARVNRSRFDRLLPLGPTDAVAPRVVDQLREEVVTVVAGMRDIAGNTHEDSIVALLEAEIAGGYGDGTYRPGQVVTRGQMATFVTAAFELPPGRIDLPDDVAGTTHADGIAAVLAAGIAGGYADGSYRPDEPVSRGHMATFLANALDLEAKPSGFSDTAGSPHEGNIGAVSDAEIARGFADGTFRATDRVTRAQMATFLINALER